MTAQARPTIWRRVYHRLDSLYRAGKEHLYLESKRFPGVRIARSAILKGRRNMTLARGVELQDYVIVHARGCRLSIGVNTQVNPFTVIYASGGITIGKNVMIAPHCMLAASNHDFVQLEMPMRLAGAVSKGPIVIEDDVWIAAHSTITDGVRIGTGAVVAANSVVTRDVAPFDVVAGAPAKVIGNRRTWSDRAALDPK